MPQSPCSKEDDLAKIPKVVAGYLPARYASARGIGTACGRCRDFIQSTSECVITIPPKVHPTRGTCTNFLPGEPLTRGEPKRIVPKEIAGYIEGMDVPTYCGRCEYYEQPRQKTSTCAKVGDSNGDTVEFGGCCNGYEDRNG
jgi:hypothetical protein